MRNGDARAAWAYHDATKHSVERLQRDPHQLDFATQPLPYKLYTDLDPQSLPRDWAPATTPALAAIAGGAARRSAPVSVATLARLLLLSAGITRKVTYANGRETYFRAAACTGALYHVDLYVVCGEFPGLAAGVYHFGPHDFSLRRLRAGDHRSVLARAAAGEEAVAAAAALLVSVSTVWRNAWKYRARAYRHCFWDDGTLMANALAAAAAVELSARVVVAFIDDLVERLLGIDGRREVALSLLALGTHDGAAPQREPELPPLTLTTQSVGAGEIDFPEITAMHAASTLHAEEEVRAWRAAAATLASQPESPRTDTGARIPLRPTAPLPEEPIDAVIRRRGSSRAFARTPIGFDELSTMLVHATQGLDADFVPSPRAHLSDLYLIAHAVDGLMPGTYVHHREDQTLELLRGGDFRREAAFLDLGQDLAGDASVNCYLLADLHRILARLGARGYRAAQLEAAITGGRLYLAAYALHLGATGLTFFDDAVTEFFGSHAAGKSIMFLTAIGHTRSQTRR